MALDFTPGSLVSFVGYWEGNGFSRTALHSGYSALATGRIGSLSGERGVVPVEGSLGLVVAVLFEGEVLYVATSEGMGYVFVRYVAPL